MQPTPEDDSAVALAVMQEAQERLLEFLGPLESAQIIASFGLTGLVQTGGYLAARDLSVAAIASALDAQLRANGLGPS